MYGHGYANYHFVAIMTNAGVIALARRARRCQLQRDAGVRDSGERVRRAHRRFFCLHIDIDAHFGTTANCQLDVKQNFRSNKVSVDHPDST